jgi:hypothetical protein
MELSALVLGLTAVFFTLAYDWWKYGRTKES